MDPMGLREVTPRSKTAEQERMLGHQQLQLVT